MDLIDRQAAIDALERNACNTQRAIEAVEALPSANCSEVPNSFDCISKQAAIDTMTETIWHYPNELYPGLNAYETARGLAEMGLLSVPPVQPEIVRCKDCKKNPHWEWVGCPMTGKGTRKPDDFCSYAERREK